MNEAQSVLKNLIIYIKTEWIIKLIINILCYLFNINRIKYLINIIQ